MFNADRNDQCDVCYSTIPWRTVNVEHCTSCGRLMCSHCRFSDDDLRCVDCVRDEEPELCEILDSVLGKGWEKNTTAYTRQPIHYQLKYEFFGELDDEEDEEDED